MKGEIKVSLPLGHTKLLIMLYTAKNPSKQI